MKNLWTKLLAALLIATLLLPPVAMMDENPSEVPAVTEAEPIEAEAIDEVIEEVAIDDLDAIAEEDLFELGEDDSELPFEEVEVELPSEDVTDANSPLMELFSSTVIINPSSDGSSNDYKIDCNSLQDAINQFTQNNPNKTITAISIDGTNDLKGLDTLTDLEKLIIINSGLSIIDLSNVNWLKEISLSNNAELSTLTLGNQPKLYHFFCSGAKLTTLDVSGCTLIKPYVNDAHKTVMEEDDTIVYSQDKPSNDPSPNPWLQVDKTVTVTGGTVPEDKSSTTTTETTTVTSETTTSPAITINKVPVKVKTKKK